MLRKFIILVLALVLSWTSGYAKAEATISVASNVVNTAITAPSQVSDQVQYPVQQVTYDDATGEYSVVLLNTPPGTPPVFRSRNIQMARLSDAEIQSGQQSYLKLENGQPVLYLTEDFKIEYVHAVTDAQTNPQTGQPETVVVRRETGFWSPFAGAVAGNLAGQAIGNLLFRPQYYVPPVYQPGVSVLRGFGGYGNSYGQAVERYQRRYNAPPLAVRNRPSNFRTTGRIRTPSYSQPIPRRSTGGFRTPGYSQPMPRRSSGGFRTPGYSQPMPRRSSGGFRTPGYSQPMPRRSLPRYNTGNRPSGSGYGTSSLRSSGRSSSSYRRPSSSSFGSSRSFGSRSRVGGRRR